jgi:uncharacterized protein YndB with AHSA1/START domain
MADRIEKSIELNAPIEKVWLALTKHDQFGEWFRVKLENPFVVGEISRGPIAYPGYEHVIWEARIQKMEAPRYFSFTWHPYAIDPKIDYSQEAPTLVEFQLEETPNGTRLVVIESGFDALPSDRKPDAFRMNDRGWAEQLQNMKQYVAP